jgi:hypothetical protein
VKISKTLAGACGVGLVVAGLLSASPATADPIGTPAGGSRTLAGVGSDTTQNVLSDLADTFYSSQVIVTARALTTNVVTLTVPSASGFTTGNSIVVSGLGAPFDGTVTVTGTTATTITYAKTNANVASAAVTANAFVRLASGTKNVASWDAIAGLPTDTFQTRTANAACVYTRSEANGSGNGRSRLLESLTAGDARTGCLDFSRSSSGKTTTSVSLTWIPFAFDNTTFVVRSDGGVPRKLTTAQLKNIYACANTPDIWPLLPQTGSGSRTFWVTTVLGITEAAIDAGTYPCLVPSGNLAGGGKAVTSIARASNLVTVVASAHGFTSGQSITTTGVTGFTGAHVITVVDANTFTYPETAANATGTVTASSKVGVGGTGRDYVQENNAIALNIDEIEPFSIGLYNVQASGTNTDARGPVNVMGQIDAQQPVVGNTATFPIGRKLYNVVPTANLAAGATPNATLVATFSGANSLVCKNTAVIAANGFTPVADCGDIVTSVS